MAKVPVSRFTKNDIVSGEDVVSKYYATHQAIEQFGGTVIEGNTIEIEEDMLDGNGMYKPKAE
jgi:hypothetical protein